MNHEYITITFFIYLALPDEVKKSNKVVLSLKYLQKFKGMIMKLKLVGTKRTTASTLHPVMGTREAGYWQRNALINMKQ